MRVLCHRLVLPLCLFQHPFEPFTTFPARNAAGLPEPGGLFSKSGRSCAGKKSIQVRSGGGALPAPRSGGQRWVRWRCGASLAWPRAGNFPPLRLPAGSAWHRDGTCWEAAHVMGGLIRGCWSRATRCLLGRGERCRERFYVPIKPPPAVASCCCGRWADAWSRSKVRAPCPAGAWGGNAAATAVPPCLAVPPLLVIYKHEGCAVARSLPNPSPPSSWGLSSVVQRRRKLRVSGTVLPTGVGMQLGDSGCALGCDCLVAQRIPPGTTPPPLT